VSIMTTETGRSVFAGRQEEIVDPKTGHIILNYKQAKEILFDFLLSDYMGASGPDIIYNTPRFTEVKILAEFVKAKGSKGKRFDFTEALEKFENEQAEQKRQVRETLKFAGTLPSRPPIREI